MARDYEMKRSYRRNYTKREFSIMDKQRQDSVQKSLNSKNPIINDTSMFNEGLIWFLQGYELNEAKEKDRNNSSFVRGYNHGVNSKRVDDMLYELGLNDGRKGNEPKYINNEHYMDGFNSARHKSR